MKIELVRGNKQRVVLTNKEYVASGGQAAIYRKGSDGYKIYHDPSKMPPLAKIDELSKIQSPNVVKPLDILYDAKSGGSVGYLLRFLDNTTPLCKLFTKGFKNDNNISHDLIVELVKNLQITLGEVHRDGCLIVDLNEMNVLVDPSWVTGYIIDTDSAQTPRFPATAIMDSIRDRKANGKWTVYSDWFSWGILAFQLYINIHPFKGSHPKYKPNEWQKRMDDGVSVFDKLVSLPGVCNPLAIVPKRHLEWFKAIFQKGERSIPPLVDSSVPIAVPQITIVADTKGFLVIKQATFDSKINHRTNAFGIEYTVTDNHVYAGDKCIYDRKTPGKMVVVLTPEGEPVIAVQRGGVMRFESGGKEVGSVATFGGFFVNNSALYVVNNGKLVENSFRKLGNRVLHQTKDVQSITNISYQIFDGVVVQDLLGKKWISIPYSLGRCLNMPVPVLDKYRIMDAKCERNVCVVIGEHGGVYDRFILTFKKDFSSFTMREVKDVQFDSINFTVLENGLCILLSDSDEVELFMDHQNIKKVSDPPFDGSMKLFNKSGAVYFCNEDTVYQVKTK